MSPLNRDNASILDSANAARNILAFTRGLTSNDFFSNVEKQSAVLYQIAIIGEATKRLSTVFRSAHPDIPWKCMAGMRDRVTHGYDDVDLDLV